MIHTRRATSQLLVLISYVWFLRDLEAGTDLQAENPDDRVGWQDCEAADCKDSVGTEWKIGR
jgi:hypothetical protein